MRNMMIGGILAAVLVAGLFLAAQYGRKPAVSAFDSSAMSAAQIAKTLNGDFVGTQKLGAWTLLCGNVHELPQKPPLEGHTSGNSEGTPPKEPPPPPHWHIPRCRVVYSTHNSSQPPQEIRVTFREFGFKRVLAVFLRFPPTEVSSGDAIAFRLDGTQWQLTVRGCARIACLAIRSIKFDELPTVNNAKTLKMTYTPSGTQEKVTVTVPTDGLAEALAAMRRIDT